MKKIIFLIVLIVISFILYVNVNASVIIPKDAIRVRVVPNSDSVYDQNIKDKIKKYVSNYMSIKLKDVYSVKKARKIIKKSVKGIIFKEAQIPKNHKDIGECSDNEIKKIVVTL